MARVPPVSPLGYPDDSPRSRGPQGLGGWSGSSDCDRCPGRRCGAPNPLAATMYPDTLPPLAAPASVTRAVCFADVVGFSGLVLAAELETLHRVRDLLARLREEAQNRGGRVVSETGDGVRVDFAGAIEAAEWSAAVHRTATGPDDAIASQPIRFRIGIHLGNVLASGDQIFGHTVNVA